MEARAISTSDGRRLTYEEAGDPEGVPVVYHHGTPGSRLLHGAWARDAEQRGIRLIGYDRAGYGASDPLPGRNIAAVAADIAALCDALGVDRFCTWGISGGGPHALACAALLPDRVISAASLAGVAPYGADGLDWMAGMGESNVEEFGATLAGRDAIAPILEEYRRGMLGGTPEGLAEAMSTLLSATDRVVLGGELAAFLCDTIDIGLARSSEGWIDDDLAFAAPWGFDPAEIHVPVLVWQGREDRFVPFGHGEWLAARIPRAQARLTDDDGHLTLLERRIPAVHAWLLESVG